MKRRLISFLIALAVLGITARAYCYNAEVVNISGNKYFPAVKEALAKAKKSIYLVMFTIELSAEKQNSKANQLINTIIEAKNRGVDVEVVLDQNVDFVQRKYPSDWEIKIKSTNACKRLKDAGIKVYYDDPVKYVHAKAVVIDKKTVILGSTNWTEAAFDRNIEVSVLIESKDLAQEILNYFKTIKKEEYVESVGKSTPISWSFLESSKIAPLMVKNQAERAFDVYLYLLWKYSEKQGDSPQKAGTVPVLLLSYDDLAKHLGIYEGWNPTDYRRQIIKVLRELEQEYKLIKFEPRYAKEAGITLLNYEDPGKVYAIPQEQYFGLPDDYFNFGWNRELSFRAKFCLLINLICSNVSDTKPYWSKSLAEITKQFGGIGEDIVYKGMDELRRKQLIDVRYDQFSDKPYDERAPKMYKLLKLYDPKELGLKLRAVGDKYGKVSYDKAKKYAEMVFEENNPEVIEDIILKTEQYGEKKVKKAFDLISLKNIDNPKRSYGYVVGILENMEGVSNSP
jgi:HKD family nuclease